MIEHITHGSPTLYPFRYFVNQHSIPSSIITVFAEGMVMASLLNRRPIRWMYPYRISACTFEENYDHLEDLVQRQRQGAPLGCRILIRITRPNR